MSCELFEEMIMEYLDGKLTISEEEKLKVHLQSCAACRKFLSAQEKQHAILKALPLFTPRRDFTQRIMKEIQHKEDALNFTRLVFFLLLQLVLGITMLYLWWPQVILGISFITIHVLSGIKMLIAVTNNWIEAAFHWLRIGGKIISALWCAQRIILKIILEIFNWHFLGYIITALMFMGTLFLAKIFPQHKKL